MVSQTLASSCFLHNLSRLRGQVFDLALQPLKITHAQALALTILAKQSEPIAQVKLASLLGIGQAALVRIVDRLTAIGMVRRQPDIHDRRMNRIYLTDFGRDAAIAADVIANDLDRRLLGDIARSDWRHAVATLASFQSATLRMLDV